LLTRKSSGGHQAKRRNEENPYLLSPRKRKACHSVSVALQKSVAKIGTQSAMKSSRKTLHEFTSHIPHKSPKNTFYIYMDLLVFLNTLFP
jgi:hypothetical protein